MERPLRLHDTFTGKSPPEIVHCTETGSPAFITSSPNAKGVIFGGTDLNTEDVDMEEMKAKKKSIGLKKSKETQTIYE